MSVIILLNSKLIRWNNDGYMYVGNSNNQLVRLANYTDVTNIKQAVTGQYTGSSNSINNSGRDITLGFQPSYIFVCVLNGAPSNGSENGFGSATQTLGNSAISITNTGFYVANANLSGYQSWLNFNVYTYSYLCFA